MKKLLILILFISNYCNAQNCEELLKEAALNMQNGNMDEARSFAEKALKNCKDNDTKDSFDYALSCFYLGSIYTVKEENLESAEIHLKTAIRIVSREGGRENDFYISILKVLSGLYNNIGAIDNEIKVKTEISELQKKLKGHQSVEYLQATQELIDTYLEKENFKKANDLYKTAQVIFKKLFETNPNSTNYDVFSWFAKYNQSNQNYDSATYYYNMSLNQIKKNFGEADINYIRTLQYLGSCYKGMSDYVSADKVFTQCVLILEKNANKNCSEYFSAKIQIAMINQRMGNYFIADSMLNSLKEYYELTKKQKSNDFVSILINIAFLKLDMGENKKAQELMEEATTIERNNNGENTMYYLELLSRKANAYSKDCKYEDGVKILEKSIEIAKKNNFISSNIYFHINGQLIILYVNIGDNKKAETLIENLENTIIKEPKYNTTKIINYKLAFLEYYKSLSKNKEYEKTINEIDNSYTTSKTNNSIDYLFFLRNYYSYFILKGDLKKGYEMVSKAIILAKNIYGENNSNLGDMYYELGCTNYQIGNYEAALNFLNKAIDIHKNNNNENSLPYSKIIQEVSLVFLKTGKYSQADSLINLVLNFEKKYLSENHPDYLSTLHNLGLSYQSNSQFEKAEFYYSQVLQIAEKRKNGLQLEELQTLTNLGNLYSEVGLQHSADSIFSIGEKLIETHPLKNDSLTYAHFAIGRASVYRKLGYFDKAEKITISLLQFYANKKDLYQSELSTALNELSLIYAKKKQYKKSIEVLYKTLKITLDAKGRSEYYSTRLGNLAFNYMKIDSIAFADSLYSISALILDSITNSRLNILSYNESNNYLKFDEQKKSPYFGFLTGHPHAKLLSPLLNLCLNQKKYLLNKYFSFHIPELEKQDVQYSTTYNLYIKNRSKISKNFQLGNDSNQIYLYNIQDSLEKILAKKSLVYRQISFSKYDWRVIQNKLNDGETAINFETYKLYDMTKDRWTDSLIYVAFMIKKDSALPIYETLFEEHQLENILENSDKANAINQLYSDKTYIDLPKNNLYNLIFGSLDKHLSGISKIFISPTGLLNRISFSAIVLPYGSRLIDKYNIQTMSNIKDLVLNEKTQIEIKNASLFGDIDYDNKPNLSINNKVAFVENKSILSESFERSLKNKKWNELKSTRGEISEIKRIMSSSNISTSLYDKQNATEENFKQMNVPSIIHFATHGYSIMNSKTNTSQNISENKSKVFENSIDPLTRSGLILSGGNQMWTKGETFPGCEDGILTAREISNMDLKGCELATLSACETGLGEINGSEGVFGLQRGFKMAGVHYMIVSLWKVPDAETADFMQTFYSKWLKDKNEIRKAFRSTQIEMLLKYKEPYKWAAFTLIE